MKGAGRPGDGVTLEPGAGSWIIRNARPADRETVLTLLRGSDLPTEGVDDRFPAGYLVVESGDGVVAVADLEGYRSFGLLRSLAVAPDWRRRGIGKALTERLLAAARTMGLEAVYLLTTTAQEYFAEKGFLRVDRGEVPADVRASAEFAGACPTSAVCMFRKPP